MSQRGKCVLLAVLAAALCASGCVPPSRVEFIETLARNNRKIARSAKAFKTAITPITTGQTADASQVRKAYTDLEKTLKEVRSDADGQMLPPSSSSAKAFLDAYKGYLDGQKDILENILLPIVQKVEEQPGDDGHPTIGEKQGYVNDLLAKVEGKEGETWGPLKQAQDAYASEHNYQVQSLSDYLAAQKSGKQ